MLRSKVLIFSMLGLHASEFEESFFALLNCSVATDTFTCSGMANLEFRFTPLSDGF